MRLRRDLSPCATVVRILARRPDSSPEPSLRESHLSASRQSIRRGKPFPSAECASASGKTEATGDPFAPPVRLSAPPGHGRPAPPLREDLRPLKCRKGGLDRVTCKTARTLREERAGRLSAERRETGGRGSPHAPRRTRGARSRIRRRSPARPSRMWAAGADARRTAARPRTARKREIEAAGRNSRSAAEAYARRAARRQVTGTDVKGLCADDCRAERGETRPLGFDCFF